MEGNPPITPFGSRAVALRDGRRVVLRRATADDAPAMRRFITELGHTSDHIVTMPDEVLPVDRLREKLEEGPAKGWLWVVAEPEGEPGVDVGDCVVRPEERRKLAHNASLGIGVADGWRGVGMGRALMDAAVAWARANPRLARLELCVFTANTNAVALYESMGFAPEGTKHGRVREPDGTLKDELHMALDVSA